MTWMGGRAVEGTGLENRQGRKFLVGSNPTPSAILSLLAAPANEVRDAWREAGRAGNIVCQEIRGLVNEAIATSEDRSSAPPPFDTLVGLDRLLRVSGELRAAPRDPQTNASSAWRHRRH
jgi:hypothetical protein